MGNVGYPASVLEMGEVHATARTLGLKVVPLEIRQAEDIEPAFERLKDKGDAKALYVCTDALTDVNGSRINALASPRTCRQ
jgi:ABC-type uncharacterized transport system substrate-binding protein